MVLRVQFCTLASCCLSQMRRNSVLEGLSNRRFAVIQEMCCKAFIRQGTLEGNQVNVRESSLSGMVFTVCHGNQ